MITLRQRIKDVIMEHMQDLGIEYLERKLKPIEVNMFFYKYSEVLEKLYVELKNQIDKPVLEYFKTLKDKNENTST